MNRRGFLKALSSLIVAPAFIPAARLLLPPERPFLPPLGPVEFVTFDMIQRAAAVRLASGLSFGKSVACVSQAGFDSLVEDLNAMRRYAAMPPADSQAHIDFYSAAGDIRIIPSQFVKEGAAYVVHRSAEFLPVMIHA